MTQPTERRFVMEPRLDAEVETINDALATKVDTTDARLSDQRVPTDNSVTSAKIANGAIVDADVNASAAIAPSKIAGTAVTQADTQSVTSTMIVDKTIVAGDIADNTIVSENLADLDYVQFDTTYAGGSTAPGELAWDQENETLEFMLDEHVTLQIGQEHVMRVKNNSGSVAIPERTVVMFAGAAGDTIKVSPAVSDGSVNVNYLAGITTEEIPADGFGFITQLGFINQVNTNGWVIGTLLYVDPATPGGLTATEPVAPAWVMPVAAVTKQSLTAGRILVRSIPGGSGAGGGASVVVAETSPVSGNEGDLWLDSTDGTLYVYYEDVDGSQWIQVQANSALGASIESRLGALESQAIAFGALSPNYLLNSDFSINQRGFTSTTTSAAYGFDRWLLVTNTGTTTYSTQSFGTSPTLAAGVEATNFARLAISGQSGAEAYSILRQNIENVKLLAGKTVTVSFWAKAASGTPYVAATFEQYNGSTFTRFTGKKVTISTSWARYSMTFTIPSVSGQTVGADNITKTAFELWCSAGTIFNDATASMGVQNNTFDFWGVQVEAGSTATSFRRNAPSIQAELAACQRYYWKWTGTNSQGLTNINFWTTNDGVGAIHMPATMRIPPTATLSAASTWNVLANGANYSVSTPDILSTTPNIVGVRMFMAAGGTSGTGGILRTAAVGGAVSTAEFYAEL